MTKYSGFIGLMSEEQETAPGVWAPTGVEELKATGNVLGPSRSFQNGEKINADVSVADRLSIIASRSLEKRIGEIRYATLYGTRWTVDTVSYNRPRLELTLGGVWNGDIPRT